MKSNTNNASQVEIQNLKQVLSSKKFATTRRQNDTATSAASLAKNTKRSATNINAESYGDLELPIDSAQRWMSNAHMQASQSMLRKHGGDYFDTKIDPLPVPRQAFSSSKRNSPDFTKTGLSKVESDMNDGTTAGDDAETR